MEYKEKKEKKGKKEEIAKKMKVKKHPSGITFLGKK